MLQEARIEVILNKLIEYDIYFREFMQVDLAKMKTRARHRVNIVDLDSEESDHADDTI